MDKQIESVLDFWFTKPISAHWFSSTPEIDQHITDNYEAIWEQAKVGEFNHWKDSANGCLAYASY